MLSFKAILKGVRRRNTYRQHHVLMSPGKNICKLLILCGLLTVKSRVLWEMQKEQCLILKTTAVEPQAAKMASVSFRCDFSADMT